MCPEDRCASVRVGHDLPGHLWTVDHHVVDRFRGGPRVLQQSADPIQPLAGGHWGMRSAPGIAACAIGRPAVLALRRLKDCLKAVVAGVQGPVDGVADISLAPR